MTTTLPRPIEPGDIKPGQRVRARATHLGDLDLYELTVTSVSEDAISGRWVYLSPERYTWTLLEDVPEPAREVGSHWRDPETGTEYVRTDRLRAGSPLYVPYLKASEASAIAATWSDSDAAIVARLVPIPSRADLAEAVAVAASEIPCDITFKLTAALEAWRAAQ